MAEIHQDGSYDVTTLVGANRVTVAIPSRSNKQGAPFQRVCEVQIGDNSFDLAMP